MRNKLIDLVIDHYEEQGEKLDELAEQNRGLNVPTLRDIERSFTLQVVDRLWMDHIDALDVMRASIHFRSIGQRDPLVEFKNEAFHMFDNLKMSIQHYIVDELLRSEEHTSELQSLRHLVCRLLLEKKKKNKTKQKKTKHKK